MKKALLFISVLILFSLTQITFATKNGLNSVPSPVTIIINGSEQKVINFNLDKTATLDLPADPIKKTASIKLAPGNQEREILLSCNNQHITGDQLANCPVSPSSITQLRLTDVTPVEEKSIIKPVVMGGAVAGTVGAILAGGAMILVGGPIGAAVYAAITAGGFSAFTGAGIMAAGYDHRL